ncbi:MAG: general secretion pathway protein C [Comamonadaceae bacterium]|nr:general secretion pathway protein C [Comamonadaceae bacterium]
MPVSRRHRLRLRLVTLVLGALAGASVVYWGLRLSRPATVAAVPVASVQPAPLDGQALARLLGANRVAAPVQGPAPEASRLALRGVLAGTRSGHGAALIAIDDKPPKPYRVGAQVQPGLVVQSLGRREARLGAAVDGATTVTLELPLKSPHDAPAALTRGG